MPSQSPDVVEIPVPRAIRQWVWFVIGIPSLQEHAVQLMALIFEQLGRHEAIDDTGSLNSYTLLQHFLALFPLPHGRKSVRPTLLADVMLTESLGMFFAPCFCAILAPDRESCWHFS